jgi:polar amino acid transport system substrate-binding protein
MMKWKCLAVLWVVLCCSTQLFAEQKVVTLATLEWEPYVGSEMSSNGLTAEIISESFKKAGYKVIFKFYPWTEGMAAAREGRVDGIFPAYYDKSRAADFVYSDELLESPLGLYRKTYKSSPGGPGAYSGTYKKGQYIVYPVDPRINQTEALKGLKEFTFGVVAGYVNTPEFDAADFLTKVEAANDQENLTNLFEDKVQLIVVDKYVAKNILVHKFPWRLGEFEFMEPPLAKKPLHIIFSTKVKDHEQKLKDFNAGLKLVKEDGLLKKIMRKYGF